MISALSITHKTAGVGIREMFSISEDEIKPLADRILFETEVAELVVLSTCNRTEIYFYHDKNCSNKSIKQLIGILHSFKSLTADYSEKFKVYKGKDAARHLFEVTSGVDSMVIGEDQIVKQVKEAYLLCTNLAITDAVLMRLFQKSFETGKKVRTETNIQKGATSVSYVAVELVCEKLEDITNKNILLLGVGDTGKDVLSHFRKKGTQNLILANRTFEKAERMADELGGMAIPYDTYPELLAESDVIVTATNAGKELITKADVAKYIDQRTTPQMFIDLSVPRNIDTSIGDLDNAEVFGVDDLHETLSGKQEVRLNSIVDAEAIIETMVEEYYNWLDSRRLRPLIKAITSTMQDVNESELNQWNRCLSNEEMKIAKEFGNKLSQKYIRSFIKNLKEISAKNHSATDLQMIQELFKID